MDQPKHLSTGEQLASVDIKQTGARVRRMLISLACAVIAGGVTGLVCWQVMAPAEATPYAVTPRSGARYALGYFAGGAAIIAYVGANWWLKRRHDRATALVPAARVHKD